METSKCCYKEISMTSLFGWWIFLQISSLYVISFLSYRCWIWRRRRRRRRRWTKLPIIAPYIYDARYIPCQSLYTKYYRTKWYRDDTGCPALCPFIWDFHVSSIRSNFWHIILICIVTKSMYPSNSLNCIIGTSFIQQNSLFLLLLLLLFSLDKRI